MQTQTVSDDFQLDFEFSKSSSKLVKRLCTRWKHGSIPVSVWETETRGLVYELEREEGSEFYRSARRLLLAVTGRDRHQTFSTYFRVDQVRRLEERPNVVKVLDRDRRKVVVPAIRGELRQTDPVIDSVETRSSPQSFETLASGFEFRRAKGGLKLTEGANEELVRSLVVTFEETAAELGPEVPVLGVDLVNRSHEVRKLLFKSFRGHMLVKGYDPEDVLQEIYKGLITRNNGICPWDGRKSTFGYYVTLVIRCVLTNYHRKMSRRQDREHEELGEEHVQLGTSEVESSEGLARESLTSWLNRPDHGGDTRDGRLAVRILPLVVQGMQRREIVEETGESETSVSRALAHLRKWSKPWADEIGVAVNERKRRKRAGVLH